LPVIVGTTGNILGLMRIIVAVLPHHGQGFGRPG
jgi:hypothetical protein